MNSYKASAPAAEAGELPEYIDVEFSQVAGKVRYNLDKSDSMKDSELIEKVGNSLRLASGDFSLDFDHAAEQIISLVQSNHDGVITPEKLNSLLAEQRGECAWAYHKYTTETLTRDIDHESVMRVIKSAIQVKA